MRLKQEKWAKLVISDEQRRHLESFLDQSEAITTDHRMFPRHAADSDNFPKHRWPAPDTHGLADTSQVKSASKVLGKL